MLNVCVFCGSKSGDRREFQEAAKDLGRYLAVHRHVLVYGGGSTGVMGGLADSVLRHGGSVTGVIPEHLARPELMHSGVMDMRITRDMHERKSQMHQLSDVYVALPGGFGTMEEFFEATTWAQLELHDRPVAILNICGIYDGLISLMDQMLALGFLSHHCRSLVSAFNKTSDLCDWIGQIDRRGIER